MGKEKGSISVIAALIVLFFAMLDPLISMVIAVTVLGLLEIYKLMQK
ncbi:hypothetical protein KKG83_00020 [Candidatus Micrarchaeota archaeon]|nr:hypothetical protein [Candidatus Micrarchaeota archaeon]MBU2475837.1 hypothetical protein [Candidatus Micrarchaeota archaeon]